MNVKGMSVRRKLVLTILAVVVLGIVSALAISIYQNIKLIKLNKANESDVITGVIAQYAVGPLVFDDAFGGEEALQQLVKIPSFEKAVIFNSNDEIFASYSKYKSDAMHHMQSPASLEFHPGYTKTHYIAYHEIELQGDSYGWLVVKFSLLDVENTISQYLQSSLYVLVGTVLGSVLVSFIIGTLLTGPIIELTKSARKITEENDYSVRVSTSKKDEVGELYSAFNIMLEQIEDRRITLEKLVGDLDHAVNDLTTSNEMLERFAYICSHDLQEPVRTMTTYCQLFSRYMGDQLDEKAARYLKFITDGSENAHAMIADLLLFCGLDQAHDLGEQFQFEKVCHSVENALAVKIQERNAKFIFPTDSLTLYGVRTQCYQVILNLVGNGIKFNSSEEPAVIISTKENGEFWEIKVKDNGIGIAEENHSAIFEIFKRVNKKTEFPGTGVGLAITKKIIDKNGGKITLQSALGEGCTFTINWPKNID